MNQPLWRESGWGISMVVTATSSFTNMKSTTKCTIFFTCGKYVHLLSHNCHTAMFIILLFTITGQSYLCKPFTYCNFMYCFRVVMQAQQNWQHVHIKQSLWTRSIMENQCKFECLWGRSPCTLWPFSRARWWFMRWVCELTSLLEAFNTWMTHFSSEPPWEDGRINSYICLWYLHTTILIK